MVCVSDIPGQSHIKHLKTGYKVENLKELPEVLNVLLKDDSLREKLSENGYEYISQFKWERAYKKLKSIVGLNKWKN